MKKNIAKKIYQIKITLNGVRPPIWRKLQVPSNITLSKLHGVLQRAMGWQNYHLHQFIDGKTFFGEKQEDDFGVDILDENNYKLSDLLPEEKNWIKYEYDFGDGWEHKILLEKILPFDKRLKLPACIKGKRACPPEDCGGVWGYEELLEKLEDPKHPEYEETTDWLGYKFNPETFNLHEINSRLTS